MMSRYLVGDEWVTATPAACMPVSVCGRDRWMSLARRRYGVASTLSSASQRKLSHAALGSSATGCGPTAVMFAAASPVNRTPLVAASQTNGPSFGETWTSAPVRAASAAAGVIAALPSRPFAEAARRLV